MQTTKGVPTHILGFRVSDLRGSSVKDPTPKHEKRTTSPMPKILMPVTFFWNSLKPAILGGTKPVGIILELYSVDRSSKLSPMRGAVYARTDGHRE